MKRRLGHGRLQEQHRVVRRRAAEIDLREAGEQSAEQRGVDGSQLLEELPGLLRRVSVPVNVTTA